MKIIQIPSILIFLVFLFSPLTNFGQENKPKSNTSSGLNISGLFDNSKPVILVEYDSLSTSNKILVVDVLVTITDDVGLQKVILDGEVFNLDGVKNYRKVITTPNMHELSIIAVDVNNNTGQSATDINVMTAALTTAAAAPVIYENKLALVIGNSDYEHSAPLKNPKNDADSMTSTLIDLGFEVITVTDASKEEMMDALKEFSAKLQGMDIALFFYAGHGMQVKGKNYLIPVDAKYENGESDVEFESINVEMLTKVMDSYMHSSERLNLLVLDACRNNPYRTWSRGGEVGLASMTAPSGTLVAYSTAPGSVSSDGSGSNGLYTGELIKQLKISQRIEDVFINTRNEVERLSNGTQSPWELARLKGKYFLK